MVYLPMAYLYGVRFVYNLADQDEVTLSLREELYDTSQTYDQIPWSKTRHFIAECDNYSPIPGTMKFMQNVLVLWERFGGFVRNFVRRKGLDYVAEYMHAEDLQTNFIDIGPVNKVCTCLHGSGAQCLASHRNLIAVRRCSTCCPRTILEVAQPTTKTSNAT